MAASTSTRPYTSNMNTGLRAAASALREQRRVERLVERYAQAEGLFPDSGRVVVAVSGGPDSTALLLILNRLAEKRSLRLIAAHFDHRLRGEEASVEEKEAVERLLARTGLEGVFGSGDVSELAKKRRLSLEDAARRARYAFLADVAKSRGFSTVATGHTRDDQAETVLMHILRGAGLKGLAGMSPRSPWPEGRSRDLVLVRPLLALGHEEAEAYCRAAGVETIEDASNRSGVFLRNRLRQEVLPYLRKLNPAVDLALVRLAEAARADVLHIEEAAGTAFERRGDAVFVDRDRLRPSSSALRRHAFRLALEETLGDLEGVGERHIVALENAATAEASGARLRLMRGVVAEVLPNEVELRIGPAPVTTLPEEPALLPVPGEAPLGHMQLLAGEKEMERAIASAEVDAESVGERLVVRRRRPGDRMQPLGLQGTKKLQDIFVDARVPRRTRDSVPVFENERGIVWVGGIRVAEWARRRPGRPIVVLSYGEA
jgi:tRNA(Ile)-lysidine synthase